jgi:hypothetical protein
LDLCRGVGNTQGDKSHRVDWIPLVRDYKIPDEGFFTPHDFFAGGIFYPTRFFTPHDFFAGGIFLPEGFLPHTIFLPTDCLSKSETHKIFLPGVTAAFLYLALGGSLKKKTTPREIDPTRFLTHMIFCEESF